MSLVMSVLCLTDIDQGCLDSHVYLPSQSFNGTSYANYSLSLLLFISSFAFTIEMGNTPLMLHSPVPFKLIDLFHV